MLQMNETVEVAYNFRHRYRSFASADAWRDYTTQFAQQQTLHRMDCGAEYVIAPMYKCERRAVRRAFVLDLDMDEECKRDCSCKKDVCNTCWPMLSSAVRRLQDTLRDVCQWSQFCVFFSGRRGVHLYCLDDEAFELCQAARNALGMTLSKQCPYLDVDALRMKHLLKFPLTIHPDTQHLAQFLADVEAFRPEQDRIHRNDTSAIADNVQLFLKVPSTRFSAIH